MATQTYNYGRADNPQIICDWIAARGGRAIPAGVSAMGVAVLFDSGFGTNTKMAFPGDVVSYDTVTKQLTTGLKINLGLGVLKL